MVALRTISQIVKSKFSTIITEASLLQKNRPHFVWVVCGFPKDIRAKYKTGKFGDDAWFSTTNKYADVIGKYFLIVFKLSLGCVMCVIFKIMPRVKLILFIFPRLIIVQDAEKRNKKYSMLFDTWTLTCLTFSCSCRIYLHFHWSHLSLIFLPNTGVADGVGGWRNYGIDAGEFSNYLMRTCERIVKSECFNPQQPVDLLASSYYELLEHKKPILGKWSCILQFIVITWRSVLRRTNIFRFVCK